ncbi:hypothetical protein EDC01DRAFT_779131 [Geopyxis carbonaria]|nr:hypothetical protein EDC01DRAFT_779131 [Geopyxis carbonaria]
MEPDRPSARSPACPTCRDKKAKCERAHCANCGLPCIYTGCVMREKEAGSRRWVPVPMSSPLPVCRSVRWSEQRLKEVNERLSKIEDTMGRILGLLEGGAAPTPSTTAPPSVAGQGGAEFDWPGWQGYRNGL